MEQKWKNDQERRLINVTSPDLPNLEQLPKTGVYVYYYDEHNKVYMRQSR
jgi:uncharacterized protein YwqG